MVFVIAWQLLLATAPPRHAPSAEELEVIADLWWLVENLRLVRVSALEYSKPPGADGGHWQVTFDDAVTCERTPKAVTCSARPQSNDTAPEVYDGLSSVVLGLTDHVASGSYDRLRLTWPEEASSPVSANLWRATQRTDVWFDGGSGVVNASPDGELLGHVFNPGPPGGRERAPATGAAVFVASFEGMNTTGFSYSLAMATEEPAFAPIAARAALPGRRLFYAGTPLPLGHRERSRRAGFSLGRPKPNGLTGLSCASPIQGGVVTVPQCEQPRGGACAACPSMLLAGTPGLQPSAVWAWRRGEFVRLNGTVVKPLYAAAGALEVVEVPEPSSSGYAWLEVRNRGRAVVTLGESAVDALARDGQPAFTGGGEAVVIGAGERVVLGAAPGGTSGPVYELPAPAAPGASWQARPVAESEAGLWAEPPVGLPVFELPTWPAVRPGDGRTWQKDARGEWCLAPPTPGLALVQCPTTGSPNSAH